MKNIPICVDECNHFQVILQYNCKFNCKETSVSFLSYPLPLTLHPSLSVDPLKSIYLSIAPLQFISVKMIQECRMYTMRYCINKITMFRGITDILFK